MRSKIREIAALLLFQCVSHFRSSPCTTTPSSENSGQTPRRFSSLAPLSVATISITILNGFTAPSSRNRFANEQKTRSYPSEGSNSLWVSRPMINFSKCLEEMVLKMLCKAAGLAVCGGIWKV